MTDDSTCNETIDNLTNGLNERSATNERSHFHCRWNRSFLGTKIDGGSQESFFREIHQRLMNARR